jgi:heme/copper-type cytochrome/quinol oxidase subunit 1
MSLPEHRKWTSPHLIPRPAPANPWGEGATTLEWTLSSPPPTHQFNDLPRFNDPEPATLERAGHE